MTSVLATASAAVSYLFKRPTRLLIRIARWAVALIVLLWGLMLLAWGLLHWAILPHIDEWRPALERQVSQGLGVQTRIGTIVVRSGGWFPALELNEVRLLDPSGREALRLPKVAAALSARSLLTFRLRFEQLLVFAPQLEIRRDAAGRIFVAGLDVNAAEQAESSGAAEEWLDWLLSQPEFVIRSGRVRWIDERRAAPPLELSDLDLVLRNGLRSHALRLDATPPAEWGERFMLQGRFTQALLARPSEFRRWNGQLYADLPRADLRLLRRHIDLPFELSEGDGAMRAWVDVKDGRPQAATADMGLRSVRLRLTPKAPELDLERIEGRLQLAREPQRLTLKATRLGFVTVGKDGQDVVWPRSDFAVHLRLAGAPQTSLTAEPTAVTGGELTAERLDFALMAQIAARLPVGDAPRAWLADWAPQGVLSALNARWDGPLEAPTSYKLGARLDGLSIAARPAEGGHKVGRPGLHGASLQLEASERGGQAKLAMDKGRLEFPGVFEEPVLEIDKLASQIDWRIDARPGKPSQLELKFSKLHLTNADLRGEFDAVWRTGAGDAPKGRGARFPGTLELDGHIDKVAATQVQRYLPLAIAGARNYVKEAIRGGTAEAITAKVRGDLADFPYDQGRPGQFRIATAAKKIELAYVPVPTGQPLAWPALEQIDAELIFDRGSMQIRNGRARVLGYELANVVGGIKDLTHKPVLEIDGSGRGPAAELLQFMRASPVNEWTNQALAQTTASGQAALKLGLQLPLNDIVHSSVKGQVQLLGNDLRIRPDVPLLANARGKVEFDRKGLQIVGGQARAFGGDATFEGGSQRDGTLRFTAQGMATAEGLRRAAELGAVTRIAQSASGQAAYKVQLGFNQGHTELAVTSNLQGLALDLPAPLRKEAEAQLSLRLQNQLVAGGARDELRFELGNLVQAHYERDPASGRVLRGALAVQDNLAPLPQTGVQLQANLASLNVDAWQAVAQRWTAPAAVSGGAAGSAGLDALEGSGYTPGQIALRAQSLQFGGRPLTRVTAGVTRLPGSEAGWRFSLDAEQLGGFIEWRAGRGRDAGRIHARLARLSLPKSEAESVTQMLDQQPGSVPALDIVVDDFELRGKKLGRLEIDASSSGRDWRLNRLQLRHPDALLNATGQWQNEAGQAQRRTVLDWKLDVADAGNLLERLGQGRVLRGGKGQLTGQIGWQGSPLSPEYASMSGQLNVALDGGQFLKAEPGVGRLLGVLSLQSLPRRFLLDFRDVFAEGFAFDGVGGDVKIERGVASSQNLRMRGVQAAVLIAGRADLAAETQNLRVIIVPELSAGGAALAYAAINPAIGLGAFLAQWLLSRPMAAANTREFHVTGSWADPKVEKVEHRAEDKKPADKPAGEE